MSLLLLSVRGSLYLTLELLLMRRRSVWSERCLKGINTSARNTSWRSSIGQHTLDEMCILVPASVDGSILDEVPAPTLDIVLLDFSNVDLGAKLADICRKDKEPPLSDEREMMLRAYKRQYDSNGMGRCQ